jgi:uncharacterized protein (DUF1697 family)
MSRYIAFLRAINVGGHTVRMKHLQQLFESLGFAGVETFLASGNVIFEAASKNSGTLEQKIGKKLGEALGYEVATFLRSEAEVAGIAKYRPFPKAEFDRAAAFNIAFLAEAPDDQARRRLLALRTDIDDFHVRGREVYWLCRRRQSESTFTNAVLEKTIGQSSTLRGANTIIKLAAKYPARS